MYFELSGETEEFKQIKRFKMDLCREEKRRGVFRREKVGKEERESLLERVFGGLENAERRGRKCVPPCFL